MRIKFRPLTLQLAAVAALIGLGSAPMTASAEPIDGMAVTTYICTPNLVGHAGNRIHVHCTVAAPGGISFFAAPTSNATWANQLLAILEGAFLGGKKVDISYDTAGSGAAWGCAEVNCRPILAAAIVN